MIGFLNIYKHSGITSTRVISKIRKKLKIKKVGHLGTLDPLACGVLPVAVGKATRLFDNFQNKRKSYTAIFEFGYETTTLDSEGEIKNTSTNIPTKEEIENILGSFIGVQNQIPPNFSAKHVGGVRAYDLARQGIEVQLKPKKIEIYNIILISQESDTSFKFDIECSSGTYIRSIARDLAYALDSFGTMTFLERTKSGFFDLSNAVTLDDMEESEENILIPVDEVFSDYDKYIISDSQHYQIINGQHCIVNQPFIKPTFIVYNDIIIGVAEENINNIKLKISLF